MDYEVRNINIGGIQRLWNEKRWAVVVADPGSFDGSFVRMMVLLAVEGTGLLGKSVDIE